MFGKKKATTVQEFNDAFKILTKADLSTPEKGNEVMAAVDVLTAVSLELEEASKKFPKDSLIHHQLQITGKYVAEITLSKLFKISLAFSSFGLIKEEEKKKPNLRDFGGADFSKN